MAAELEVLHTYEATAEALLCLCLQSSWPAAQYAAAVVTVHLAFALLEKQRLENFEERGEVTTSVLVVITQDFTQ